MPLSKAEKHQTASVEMLSQCSTDFGFIRQRPAVNSFVTESDRISDKENVRSQSTFPREIR